MKKLSLLLLMSISGCNAEDDKCYVFEPKEDITAYELAIIYKNSQNMTFETYKNFPENVKKHIVVKECI